MIILYSGAPSITDGPQVYHTVAYDVVRNGTSVIFTFHLNSWLEHSTSWIGAGKSISFRARCTYNGVQYVSNTDKYKYLNYYWCASSSVADYDLKTPRQTGVLVADIELTVPNVGADTALTITTETIRSDNSVKPGAHSRTNAINIPVVYPPAIPTLNIENDYGVYTPTRFYQRMSVTNNGIGSGTFTRCIFQYSKNDGAWTQCGNGSVAGYTFTDWPLYAQGNTLRWRVGIENSFGLITYSAPSQYYACAYNPDKVTGLQSSAVPIVNPEDDVTIAWAVPNSGAGTTAPTLYKIKIYNYTTAVWIDITSPTNSITFKPQTYGVARNGLVKVQVAAQNSALYDGEYSDILEVLVAQLPSNVTGFIINTTQPTLDTTIGLTWNAATPNTGELKEYNIKYSYKVPNEVWSTWKDLATTTDLTLLKTLAQHSDYAAFTPNTQIRYQIVAKNTLDLISAVATESVVLTIQGGLASKKISGSYKQGLVYFKDMGHWNYATNIYEKLTGHWVEGIG